MKATQNLPSWIPKLIETQASQPVVDLLNDYNLLSEVDFPSADLLNDLALRSVTQWEGPMFKAQGSFPDTETRYYEEIIGQDRVVPTREESWHDLFNALIWIQFPKTKALLNRLHIEDIREHGVHPRTPRRNKITHFDECGVVLALEEDFLTEGNLVLECLASHQWKDVFIANKDAFGTKIHPIVFGHANLEMMLSPFEGLTGKWLAVVVPTDFKSNPMGEQREIVDDALVKRIIELEYFNLPNILKPIPLLGVPNWHEVQNETFYENTSYFRPQGSQAKRTPQLPLCR